MTHPTNPSHEAAQGAAPDAAHGAAPGAHDGAALPAGHPIAVWHRLVRERDVAGLDRLLDEQAVFVSPVVHRPQVGRALAAAYLAAAFEVFFAPGFRYVRQIVGARDAVLEFEVELDGIQVNGVDLVRWNDAGRIVEFKVIVRPLKAIQLVHERMAGRVRCRRFDGEPLDQVAIFLVVALDLAPQQLDLRRRSER